MSQNATPERLVTTRVEYPGGTRNFELFDTPLGRLVCHEVFRGTSYPLLPFLGEVRTVIDVGANVGAASVYFALHYPRARVLSFEPSPRSYRLLARNTVGLPNVTAFNFGLADRDMWAALYQGRDDSVTDSVGASLLNSAHALPVELREAQGVLAGLGVEEIDILKVDTEGCEVPILKTLVRLLPRVGALYVEYHDAADRLAIDRLMTPAHVLCRGQISDQHRGELCYAARSRFPSEAVFNQLRIGLC